MRLMHNWRNTVIYKVWTSKVNCVVVCDWLVLDVDMTEQQKNLYEQLLMEKLEIVDERDQLVQQLEADRLR